MPACARLLLVLTMLAGGCVSAAVGQQPSVSWRQILDQRPEWYGSAEAVRIADNVLLYQRDHGGWHKNIDMSAPLDEKQRRELLAQKRDDDSTIDNGATFTQLAFLARVATATKEVRYREAFLNGLDYLLKAQYPNGGWPQYYPRLKGYYQHITYNDNAMVGVLRLLRDVARGQTPYAFVDAERRDRAAKAVEKGTDCILKTQVVVKGKKTVWCAQHDEKTLAPAKARAYELPSLSGAESVGIVRFLVEIDRPSPPVSEAIRSAIAWFEAAKLTGIRVEEKRDPSLPKGRDRVVVKDPAAPPLWARFYEIETNQPFFCGRDGIKKATLAEIEHERRTGYAWYTNAPADLLTKDYPAWQRKQGRGTNSPAR